MTAGNRDQKPEGVHEPLKNKIRCRLRMELARLLWVLGPHCGERDGDLSRLITIAALGVLLLACLSGHAAAYVYTFQNSSETSSFTAYQGGASTTTAGAYSDIFLLKHYGGFPCCDYNKILRHTTNCL